VPGTAFDLVRGRGDSEQEIGRERV
jgi:hypothetical protein